MARKRYDTRPFSGWDAFPESIWGHHPDVLGLMRYDPEPRASLETVLACMPGWLNGQARAEIARAYAHDEERTPELWANAWARLDDPTRPDAHDLALMMALTVVHGWPAAAAQLRQMGAPCQALDAPAERADRWGPEWSWSTGKGMPIHLRKPGHAEPTKMARKLSALALAVDGMKSDTTNTPLSPGQTQAVAELIEAGANPNDIPTPILRKAIKHEPLIAILIEHGLDPYLPTANQRGQATGFLIEALLDVDLTLAKAARQRIFHRFLKAGMPMQADDGTSLLALLCSHAPGAYLIEDTIAHYGHEIGPDLREHEQAINKRMGKMSKAARPLLETMILEANTAQAPMVKSRGPRL